MGEEKNLVPFFEYYNRKGDYLVGPDLTYRIAGRLVPAEVLENSLVDPNTGEVVIPSEYLLMLAQAPEIPGLDIAPTWREQFVSDIEPGLNTLNRFGRATGVFNPDRTQLYNLLSKTGKDALQEGGNFAGNAVILPFTIAMGLGAVEGLVSTANLAKMAWAAGNYAEANSLIGSIVGAIVGGKVSHEIGDAAIQNISGGHYAGFADYMNKNAGMWAFNSEMMNPFTIYGGYGGSYAGSALGGGNWKPGLEAGRAELTVTPEGAQEIPFGNTSRTISGRFNEAPNAVGGSSTRVGVGYSRSVLGGMNRTSGFSRQGGRKGSMSEGNQGKTKGTPSDRLADNRSKNGKSTSPEWSVTGGELSPVVPIVGNTFMPYFGHTIDTVPRMLIPEPNKHLEEERFGEDPFEAWWRILLRDNPGGISYWPGDPNSTIPAGPKRIIMSGGAGSLGVRQTRQGVGRPDDLNRTVGTPATKYGRSSQRVVGPWNPNREHWVRVTEAEGALPDVLLNPNEAPIIYYPDLKQ